MIQQRRGEHLSGTLRPYFVEAGRRRKASGMALIAAGGWSGSDSVTRVALARRHARAREHLFGFRREKPREQQPPCRANVPDPCHGSLITCAAPGISALVVT